MIFTDSNEPKKPDCFLSLKDLQEIKNHYFYIIPCSVQAQQERDCIISLVATIEWLYYEKELENINKEK